MTDENDNTASASPAVARIAPEGLVLGDVFTLWMPVHRPSWWRVVALWRWWRGQRGEVRRFTVTGVE